MPNVNQFESVFLAATRENFILQAPTINNVVVVTDLNADDARALSHKVQKFLSVLGPDVNYLALEAAQTQTIAQLLALQDELKPNLIVTYRNLHSQAWHWPHSLGPHLDVLSQATPTPVLVIPHPQDESGVNALSNTDRVMATTDSMVGDARLVNFAIALTQSQGQLWLCHVEAQRELDRVLDAIAQIPSLDTEVAKNHLMPQLVLDNQNYINTCAQVIAEAGLKIQTHAIVKSGHRLTTYKDLIQQNEVDLLVLNTKDPEQLAMRGSAFAMAVEMRHIPLLLL